MINYVSIKSREGFAYLRSRMEHTGWDTNRALNDIAWNQEYSTEHNDVFLLDDIYGDCAVFTYITDIPQQIIDEVHEEFKRLNAIPDYDDRFDCEIDCCDDYAQGY